MDTIRRRQPGARVEEIEACYRERFADFARLATAIVGDSGRGHDVVQEAFATAIRKRRSFKKAGRLDAWICRIVVNHARNAQRRVTRDRGELRAESDQLAALVSVENGSDQLTPWLAALPDRQRLALLLRYYADLDYRGSRMRWTSSLARSRRRSTPHTSRCSA